MTVPRNLLIRERPPLRLNIEVETPDGKKFRWADDEKPERAPNGLTITSTIPGGYENFDATLIRDPQHNWPDLIELEKITVRTPGGSCVWQGRLESFPKTSGDSESITPTGVGYQGALTDNNGVLEIFVDPNLGNWQSPDLNRQIQLLELASPIDTTNTSTGGDPAGAPALITQLTGAWTRWADSEAWYDSNGIPIGSIYYKWLLSSYGTIGDQDPGAHPPPAGWWWSVAISSDDQLSSYDFTGLINDEGPSGSGLLVASNGQRIFGVVSLNNPTAGGTSGTNYPVYWVPIVVMGTSGIPTVGTPPCVLCSDVLKFLIPKYAPNVAVRHRGQSTITPTSYPIPSLAYLSPSTLSQALSDTTQYELPDWAVWEGPAFWLYPRGQGPSKQWRATVSQGKLNEAGPQVDQLWNGVIVTYTDPLGVQRSAGPPGSGCNTTDSRLLDSDPLNPANQTTPVLKRWAPLQMQTGDANGAIQIGSIFLQEQKALNSSGSATLVGHVQDSSGVYWPVSKVKAGDTIVFTDAADTSSRRIVSVSYAHDSKMNSITLDAPPDALQAILARLQVAMISVTG